MERSGFAESQVDSILKEADAAGKIAIFAVRSVSATRLATTEKANTAAGSLYINKLKEKQEGTEKLEKLFCQWQFAECGVV